MNLGKRLFSLLLVGILFVSLPYSALAKPAKKVIDYVALGDSLAAGQTPYREIDLGYADYLVDRFEQSQYTVGFTNFGVSGYTSEQLRNDVLSNPKVQYQIKEAEFITIDIGANDLLRALSNPATLPSTFEALGANLHIILSTIDSLNPHAKVYVMGYYNPFPYRSAEDQAQLLPLLDILNQTIADRAHVNGDTFVPTAKLIEKHYETYLPNPLDIHLSKEGYQLVAKEFWKVIDKSKN
ncbi:SGNH/GDSL hydrolase family protein [Lederbergia wuyishanensis]|uniref:Bacillolysin n=1 Tax=Lederbergia wuyishanensis TaxID=1347903 RepID=A0ABU0D476_9BACI|nr:GDSL-type esterase/lipase family protein [Lederbergia wuyishanensis]MCJ8008212.1 GDSL-type esterase/lipase family protein [Lederbergia wuyishanensis]MDQ0343199.1 bacillolysin [Lederbergia wuyishanensis]